MKKKHCHWLGENTVHAPQWLEKSYSDSAPSETTICQRCADFKRGYTDTNDAECSSRPNEVVTPENIYQVLKIVMDDSEIAEMVNVSSGSASAILHEKLGMKRSFPNGCLICSQWNKSNNKSTIPRAVWHCLLAINRISCVGLWQWMKHGSIIFTHSRIGSQLSCVQPVKAIWNVQKHKSQMAESWCQFFWYVHGIIYIAYLEKGKSINSDYYIELLRLLKHKVARKWPHMKKKKIIFHQKNP